MLVAVDFLGGHYVIIKINLLAVARPSSLPSILHGSSAL
jgi:hypothetical protein